MDCCKTQYNIWKGCLDDIPAVLELFSRVVEEGQLLSSACDGADQDDLRNTLHSVCKLDYPFLTAKNVDGTLIAYAYYSPQCTYSESGTDHWADFVCVVAADLRRRGLGTRLFKELREEARKRLFCITAWLLPTNLAAVSYLQAIGFASNGTLSQVASHNGEVNDVENFLMYIAPSPAIQGLGFHDLSSRYEPLPIEEFPVPLNLESDKFMIREAVMEDLPFVVAVINEACRNTNADSPSIDFTVEHKLPWFTELLEGRYPCLIAAWGDQSLGFLSLGPCGAYDLALTLSAYIRPEVRHQGVGEALWNACLEHPSLCARGIGSIVAEVVNSNGPGYGAAMKLGFELRFQLPRSMYKRGEWLDLSVLQKFLAKTLPNA